MLKARLRSRLLESREEGFAELWHEACLKRQTPSRAHESNIEFLGGERFQQLFTYVRAFNSEFLGRFPDEILAKLLEIATLHSYHEQDVIAVQAQRSTAMYVIVSGSVALFHKKADHDKKTDLEQKSTNGAKGGMDGTATEMSERAELSSDDDDTRHVEAKIAKSGYLHMLDWRLYPESNASRFRKYYCVLSKGVLSWYESKDSVRVVGSEKVSSADHCMLLAHGTVGYKKTSALLRDSERASLSQCLELHYIQPGSTHPRRAVFLARSFDTTLGWVKALQSWMDIPAEQILTNSVIKPLRQQALAAALAPKNKFHAQNQTQTQRRGSAPRQGSVSAQSDHGSVDSADESESGSQRSNSPMASSREAFRQAMVAQRWKRRPGVTLGISPLEEMQSPLQVQREDSVVPIPVQSGLRRHAAGLQPGGSSKQLLLQKQGSGLSVGGTFTRTGTLGTETSGRATSSGRVGTGMSSMQRPDTQGSALFDRQNSAASAQSSDKQDTPSDRAGMVVESGTDVAAAMRSAPRRRGLPLARDESVNRVDSDEARKPRRRRGSMVNFVSTAMGSMAALDTMQGLAHSVLGGGAERSVVKGMNIAPWHKARTSSASSAWAVASDVFGAPICVLDAGDSFGEGTMVMDRRRMSSAVALTEVRVLELSKTALIHAALYDIVLHGQVWASPIVGTFLQPHPLMRQESQISVILNVVGESAFFQQIPPAARRGLLEGGHLRHTAHGEQVLGSYVPPFTMRSPPPLYVVLHGRVEVHQGPRVLAEAMQGLQWSSAQDMQGFFPRKGQVLLAEEAWGGPLVWTDLRSLQVHKIQDQIPLEKDPNKAHRMRQQLWALQEAFTYTLVATEATTYLRIDPHDWVPVLAGVRDVVFRATTLHQILKKPPRDRAPQQARLLASLLQGFTAFQQLPLSLVLNLSYLMEYVDARSGRVLTIQGEDTPGVFLVMKGTVQVYQSDGDPNTAVEDAEALADGLSSAELIELFGDPTGVLSQGAWFGEDTLRLGTKALTTTVASEDCKIILIPAAGFVKEIRNTSLLIRPSLDGSSRALLAKDPSRRTKEEQGRLGDAVGGVAWLNELNSAERKRIAEAVQLVSAKKGDVIAKQGATTDSVTFILSGSVSLHHLGVGVDEPGHIAEGFDPITTMSEEHTWVYAPLTAKWGKCFAVVATGGSFGEVGFAHGFEHGSTVMAREDSEYFCLDKATLGHELMYLLRIQLQTKQGIPQSMRKAPGTRTEFEVVRLVAFLKEHPFFRSSTDKTLCQVAQLVEMSKYEEGEVIQTDRESDKLLHIVDGGRVRLQRVSDAGKALAAKIRSKIKETRMAKNQVPRRALLQELKAINTKATAALTLVSPLTVQKNQLAKSFSAQMKNVDAAPDAGNTEPEAMKSRGSRRLGAMERSDSQKALMKVFSRRGSLESEEGTPFSRTASANASPGFSCTPSAAMQGPPPHMSESKLAAAFTRMPSAEKKESSRGGGPSRATSPRSVGSAQIPSVLLDWGKHFVLGAAVAESKAQILRMPYGRWMHLHKVSGTLEKMDAAAFFGGMKAFSAWGKKDLAHLADKAKLQLFSRDAQVVARGQEPRSLLFLRRGRCVLKQQLPPTYHGPGGHQMVEDDKLYRGQKRREGDGSDYVSRITAGKLFRCPACQDQNKPKGKPGGKTHHHRHQHGKHADHGKQESPSECSVCHGTRAIRPAAMARAPEGKTGTEVGVGRTVGTVMPKGLINCALERMDAPLELEVVASEDCAVLSVDLEQLMDLCEAKPKLLRALTEESRRVAVWHAGKQQANIGTRTAIHEDVVQLKHPKVKGQLAGEQPNQELLSQLYPQAAVEEVVIPKNMGSLSKSGRHGALVLGNYKSKTQLPNHRLDGHTKLLLHAANAPQVSYENAAESADDDDAHADHLNDALPHDGRRRSLGSNEEEEEEEEEEYLGSGDSDGLEDFFVTTGAGMAAGESNRKAWHDDDDDRGDVRNATLDLLFASPQAGQAVENTGIQTFEQSSKASPGSSQPRSASALETLYQREAANLFSTHLEVMAGGGPQQQQRWKRQSRRRRGFNQRSLSSSPFAMDHIKALQTMRSPELTRGQAHSVSPQGGPLLPSAVASRQLWGDGAAQKELDVGAMAHGGDEGRMPPISAAASSFSEGLHSKKSGTRGSRRSRRSDTLDSCVLPVRSFNLEIGIGSPPS